MVTCGLWCSCCHYLRSHEHPHKIATELTNVCSDTSPVSLLLPPFSPRRKIVTFGLLRTSRDLQVFKGKKELLVSDFKSRLEVLEISEEGVPEAERGLELGLLHQS